MKNFMMKRIGLCSVDWMTSCKSFLYGVFGALTVHGVMHLSDAESSRIGTVNVTAILNEFVRQESARNLPAEKIKRDVSTFGKTLEEELKKFSSTHHLILLLNEAVIAGSEDYTESVRAGISRRISHEKLPNPG